MKTNKSKRVVCIGMSVCLTTMVACTNMPVGTASVDDPCNPGAAAGIGALVGAIGAAATGRQSGNRNQRGVAGGVVGGAIGALACAAVNASTRQTRTAEAVDKDLRQRGTGQVPQEATVVLYQIRVEPTATVRPGSEVVVHSVMEVASGSRERVDDLREVLIFQDTEGNQHTLKEKRVSEASSKAGRFENTFTFTMPRSVSQGTYVARTQLLVNGRMRATRDSAIQLVDAGSDNRRFAMRSSQ
jgi:hypothetical protein